MNSGIGHTKQEERGWGEQRKEYKTYLFCSLAPPFAISKSISLSLD